MDDLESYCPIRFCLPNQSEYAIDNTHIRLQDILVQGVLPQTYTIGPSPEHCVRKAINFN